ncbi:MAG: hypothetical protein AB9873_19020 [Syntrophobacteraceae bacterium]
MCVMVISSSERLPLILEKLNDIDVSHLYFHNTQAGRLGVPFASLVPFANLLVCEDAALEATDFRTGMLLNEASRLNIPILSEAALGETLSQ